MMKRMLCVVSALMLCALSAAATLDIGWIEGEEWFPNEKDWVYHYSYAVPEVSGDELLSEELNHYFDTAIGEMINLVLPMFAKDMAGEGGNVVSDRYEITCNNDAFFSFVLYRHQVSNEQPEPMLSLQSAVYAVSGPYKGDSLTLRGLAGEIGESSVQISDYVLQDVWRQIEERMLAGDESIRSDMSLSLLETEFFPQTHFYADQDGNLAFYLQPGFLGPGDELPVFTYTSHELEGLMGL